MLIMKNSLGEAEAVFEPYRPAAAAAARAGPFEIRFLNTGEAARLKKWRMALGLFCLLAAGLAPAGCGCVADRPKAR